MSLNPDPCPVACRRCAPPGAALSSWTAPDGWPLRRLDWPRPGARGRLLFLGGRADLIEKHHETLAHFHRAGWSLTSFDWRGQGGSGRLSGDARVGHCADFTPLVGDLAALWSDWSAVGTGPRVAIGHSMGGHLLLRAMVEGAVDPDAAVLVAPMLGVRSPFGAWAGARLARLIERLGDPARPAWREATGALAIKARMAILTHDADRFADEGWWYARHPELRLGPPSWAWIAEAFRSAAALRADPRLASLAVPILMLVADHDRLVDARAARRVAARLPRAKLVRFGREAAHEILREVDPVRTRALAAIDAFLDEHSAR